MKQIVIDKKLISLVGQQFYAGLLYTCTAVLVLESGNVMIQMVNEGRTITFPREICDFVVATITK